MVTEIAPRLQRQVRLQGLSHFTYPVRDQYAAARFYTAIFNSSIGHLSKDFLESCPSEVRARFAPSTSQGMSVELCDGIVVALFTQSESEGPPAPDAGHPHHAFEIAAEDVMAWLAHLRYWGVPYGVPRRRCSIYFYDLDGNKLEITCSNPPDAFKQMVAEQESLDEERWPANDNWPSPERAAEADKQFEEKLEALASHS